MGISTYLSLLFLYNIARTFVLFNCQTIQTIVYPIPKNYRNSLTIQPPPSAVALGNRNQVSIHAESKPICVEYPKFLYNYYTQKLRVYTQKL